MRLDKFLKNARLIKRRTIANEACAQGRVTVNEKIAKPSNVVKEGDIISIQFGEKRTEIEVLQVSEHVSKADATKLYEVRK